MIRRRLSLRYLIPLFILALGLVALGTTYVLNIRHAVQQLERNAEDTMRTLATVTAGTLEAAYRGDDTDQARAAIERLAGHRRIHHALMVNPDGMVEHATRVRWLNAPVSELEHGVPATLVAHLTTSRSARIEFGPQRSVLHGAFPIRIRGMAETFVPETRAWLMMAFDLTEAKTALRRDTLARLAIWALLLLLGCAVLYLFLRRTVLTRIVKLRAATRAVATGDFSSQPSIRGTDEIADLAEDFRTMTRNLRSYQDRFQALNFRDAQTGLYNRHGLERHLSQALADAHDSNRPWLLCNFDIEGIKVINSTRGHAAGDALLAQVAEHLEKMSLDKGIPARIVGDEFALLTPVQGRKTEELVHDIHASLESLRFQWEESSQPVRINLGAVVIDQSIDEVETATSLANAARLAAKDASYERVRIGRKDDPDLDLSTAPMRWVGSITAALESDRFELFAQEIQPSRLGSEPGLFFEVLVRLRQPDGELISPGMFLPAAEKYRLAGRIDLWVIKHLFEFFNAEPEHLKRISLCSINLSGLSLGSEQIIDLVSDELKRGALRADQLCFEITETAAITNLSAATAFIARLRGLGCRFALDDFGSGVSSFGYLKSLEVDFLKMDGMFVRGIGDDRTDRAIVKSINEIGHQTGKQTIAEFVETSEVADILRKIGVDYLQGYGIGRPMTLEKMLRRSTRRGRSALG
ncbi:EAL domain-containing protein [Wenzhouxiangella sp. XN201]|uniref:EAL domain-containing protein n=1 Tax=Wenzhouxiangella sp. XN201 TaxID=2710755 RepID=UPI0013C6F8E3|nr:EAL domain-containing protein [Wenzhouxiangella sp. XN201]